MSCTFMRKFILSFQYSEEIEYTYVMSFTKITPVHILETIFIVMFNHKDKLHDLGDLVVIRSNVKTENTVFQILRSVHSFNGYR